METRKIRHSLLFLNYFVAWGQDQIDRQFSSVPRSTSCCLLKTLEPSQSREQKMFKFSWKMFSSWQDSFLHPQTRGSLGRFHQHGLCLYPWAAGAAWLTSNSRLIPRQPLLAHDSSGGKTDGNGPGCLQECKNWGGSRPTNPYYICLSLAMIYYSKEVGVAWNHTSLLVWSSRLTPASSSTAGLS